MLPTRLKFILDRRLTVANLLDKAVDARPDCVLFRTDEDLSRFGIPESGLTAAGLRLLVNRIANLLQAHGVRQFDRVAIWKSNSLDYFLFSFAAMRLGAIAVPVNGGMAPESLAAYIGHCGAAALVTDTAGAERLRSTGQGLPASVRLVLDADGAIDGPALHDAGGTAVRVIAVCPRLAAQSATFDPPHMDHDQDVLICHTSGTTGFPKGVLHCSRSLMLAARGQLRIQFISRRNVAMTAAWMNHHIALSGCFTSVAAGMCVHVMVNHDAAHLLRSMQDHRVNVFFAFPDVYQRICRAGPEGYDLSSLRMWMSGGDAMHEVHIRRLVGQGAFLRLFGRPLVSSVFCELLGTSEVGVVALMKMSTTRTTLYGRCVGRPTPISPKVKVADADGFPVRPGTVGRLMVKGPTVFKGYWNAHDRSHGVVRDGWWWTGDLAVQDSAGRFYQIDRDVDAVATDAGPVHGLLVEEEALKHPGVEEAVVIALPDPAGRPGVEQAALVVQASPSAALDPEAVLGHVRGRLEMGGRIGRVIVVHDDADIPRGLTGKVLKRVLRDRLAAVPATRPRAPTPASSTVQAVA